MADRTSEPGRRPRGQSEIMRHAAPDDPGDIAIGDSELIEAVERHIEKHIGKPDTVFHEIISLRVHIDVHWVKPSAKLPANVLVTSGMSSLPMTVPEGYTGPAHMELCCFLPPDWTPANGGLPTDSPETERWYWPIRWLKMMARLPHEYGTFLGPGHTVPNGEVPEPFCDNVEFCAMMVTFPYPAPMEFLQLQHKDCDIAFFQAVPLFKQELNLKLKRGAESLERAWRKQDVLGMYNASRKNAGKKFLGLF